MKYKLLGVSKYPIITNHPDGVNIGDYIQALAASQFYPSIDGFIDRDEELHCYDGVLCKVIMNGWYKHNPENWPPSEHITPLYVAFHLNDSCKHEMLTPPCISYLQHWGPIGCRDEHTLQLLKEQGVDAYFSGCMTLTLGLKYSAKNRDGKTYIVDPLYDVKLTLFNVFKAILTIILNPRDICKLISKGRGKPDFYKGRHKFRNLLKTALYYREYSRIFSKEIIANSEYITQQSAHYMSDFKTDEERLKEAERLVRLYAKASFVITSRLHCALPSLGLGTPVVFITDDNDSISSSCRYGGLKELMNVVSLCSGTLIPQFEQTFPITKNNLPNNKETWKALASSLASRCRDFIKGGID